MSKGRIENRGYAAQNPQSGITEWAYDIREPREDEVVIEVMYCGICHSDIHVCRNEWKSTNYPVVPGHEFVGRVVRKGDKVDFKEQALVAVGVIVDCCGACDACNDGCEQHCDKVGKTYNGQSRGETTYGGYGKYVVCRADFAYLIPEGMNVKDMAPLMCAGITTWSPIVENNMQRGNLKIGVIGLGGLGHMALQFSRKISDSNEVWVISRNTSKLEQARQLGAAGILPISGADSAQEECLKQHFATFDYLIDTVSSGTKPMSLYMTLLKRKGKYIMVALPPANEPITLPTQPLIMRNREIQGSLIGNRKQTAEMIDFCFKNNVYPLVEHIRPDKIDDAYDRVVKGDVKFRFVIDMV